MTKKLNERGLPSVGGVYPGDTSGNLGQARRSWSLTGATGGHSQSADSGFSSKLGRVNKGRDDDKYAYRVMFPENEEEETEEDTYDMSIRSKISHDLRGRKPMPERKLTIDIDRLIAENEEFQMFLEDDRSSGFGRGVKNFFKNLAGDVGANLVGWVPGIDPMLVVFNLGQLKNNIRDGKDLIAMYHMSDATVNLEGEYYNELHSVSDSIEINLFDVVERVVSILPVGGDVASAGLTLKNSFGKLKSLFKLRKGASITQKLSSKILKKTFIRQTRMFFNMLSDDEKKEIDNDESMLTAVGESLSILEVITNIIDNYDQAYGVDENYETLSLADKSKIWIALSDGGQLQDITKSGAAIADSIAESKIRSLISQILLEESEPHDCKKSHPNESHEKWEADQADLEEHSIGGYTGPMASPGNPKQFYKGMLKSYPGSNYVGDLPKSKA
jgi:hypothetical protein